MNNLHRTERIWIKRCDPKGMRIIWQSVVVVFIWFFFVPFDTIVKM